MADTEKKDDLNVVKENSAESGLNKIPIEKDLIEKNIIGKVKWFNSRLGYGFITRDDNKTDLFIHITEIVNPSHKKFNKGLVKGESVQFDIVQGRKGMEAVNLTGPNGEPVKGYARKNKKKRKKNKKVNEIPENKNENANLHQNIPKENNKKPNENRKNNKYDQVDKTRPMSNVKQKFYGQYEQENGNYLREPRGNQSYQQSQKRSFNSPTYINRRRYINQGYSRYKNQEYRRKPNMENVQNSSSTAGEKSQYQNQIINVDNNSNENEKKSVDNNKN